MTLAEANWLVRFAATADLTVSVEWDSEMSIDALYIGAMQGLRDTPHPRPKVSDFKRLINAHEEARKVIAARRASAAQSAIRNPKSAL